jgi:drug/metabolite transporter (DMT)-like permease
MGLAIYSILFGIISTTQLHLAKAMERQSIDVFDQIRAKLKKEEIPQEIAGAKKPILYIIAMVLNNTVFLYMMASGYLGTSAVYFTSMFGIGLIFLMIYSTKVLKEPIMRVEYAGAAVLISGTIILGLNAIFGQDPSSSYATMDTTAVWLFVATFSSIGGVCILVSYKTGKATGLIYGLFAGMLASLDPVYKALGSQLGGTSSFLPSTTQGWIFFIASFGVTAVSFTLTQWGFARKASASVLVPMYNSAYVVTPIIIQIVAWPGYQLGPLTIVGLALVITGIILMRAFKKEEHFVKSMHQMHEQSLNVDAGNYEVAN